MHFPGFCGFLERLIDIGRRARAPSRMSQLNDQNEVVVEETVVETVELAPEQKKTAAIPLYLVIVLFVGALLLMLFVVKTRTPQAVAIEKDDAAKIALMADLEAQRGELNRQRQALGFTPISSGSESVDEIAARLTKDSATLVALTNSFQKLIAEKEAQIGKKNEDLIIAEKARQDAMEEIARLQAELQAAKSGQADNRMLLDRLTDLESQRDSLRASLDNANSRLASFSKGSLTAEQAEDISRQLNEATRAKGFLEKRVAELESKLGK